MVVVLVVAGFFSIFLSLFLYLFLNCCSGFLYSLFFHVTLGNNASFEFLKLCRCSLFCFKTSLTGMISSSLQGVLPSLKVLWSIKFLISILIACNQVLRTSSSSYRTALKDCRSGRYLSTGLSLVAETVALMLNMAV